MSTLKVTPLNARHRALGAKMVDFGGWDMPVQYHSILKEHEAVRQRAGLFDVSHMGVFALQGPDAMAAIQYLIPNDVTRLQCCNGLYTQFCNETGGTIDDLLIFSLTENHWWLVVNAGNRDKDFNWIQSHISNFDVTLTSLADDTGILALQGPSAAAILGRVCKLDLNPIELPAFSIRATEIAGHKVMLSRSGYTGEDGFEIYVPHEYIEAVWDSLMTAGQTDGLEPVGLGARDTLRLEAAMPLYGHELDDETSPLSAGIGWSVKLQKEADFIGKAALVAQKAQGLPKVRIGFVLEGKRAPRQDYTLWLDGEQIGVVTSGSLSPTLGYPIGMAYIQAPWSQDLPESFDVDIRGQRHPARRVKLPFYKRS